MLHSKHHAAMALGLCLVLACRSREPDGVALLGATLIDGSGGPPLGESAIVVRRGHIESVGSREDFQLPERTTVVDLTGKWIIPGLVDGHVHLVDPQGVARWSLTRYLAWGVTSVRDVHGPLRSALALRRQLNRGWSPGPRVYSAGAMIDGVPSTYPDAITARTPQEARRGVDRLVNAGVDLVKVYSRMDKARLAALLDEARVFNLRVAGHLGLTDAVTAARLGLGSLEHLSGIPEAASTDPGAALRRAPAIVLRGMDRVRARVGRSGFGIPGRTSPACSRRARWWPSRRWSCTRLSAGWTIRRSSATRCCAPFPRRSSSDGTCPT